MDYIDKTARLNFVNCNENSSSLTTKQKTSRSQNKFFFSFKIPFIVRIVLSATKKAETCQRHYCSAMGLAPSLVLSVRWIRQFRQNKCL